MKTSNLLSVFLTCAFICSSLNAQDEISPAEREFQKIEWQTEGIGKLKREAEIEIPQDFIFTDRKGTEIYLNLTGNPVGDDVMGIIAPASIDWWVLFRFDDVGYVKDDDEIDSDKLMSDMQKNDKPSNEYRRKKGLSPIWVDGWQKEPFYNPDTNDLEWAIRLRDEDGNFSVNYQTKILGRRGVMEAVLVCGPDEMASVLPEYKNMLSGFQFSSGNKYSEFKEGDKVAKYGLAALIAGGGVAVAAKTGLFAVLAKNAKAVVLGIVAVFAGLWSGIKRFFGR